MKNKSTTSMPNENDQKKSPCIELFSLLETMLHGEQGAYKRWERISKFLDDTQPQMKTAIEICNALKEVKNKFGVEIACELYNSQAVVYPSEIINAAKYLSMGGEQKFLAELSEAGLFMRDLQDSHESYVREVVEKMNSGETARSAINGSGSEEPQISNTGFVMEQQM